MSGFDINNFIVQALYLIVVLSAPVLLTAMIVGLIISLLQAVTQIQEQTLSFVPKMVATFIVIALTAGWVASSLYTFAVEVFKYISNIK
ncbi:MAG: flagellar biosynthesis protein FliQ [bacterium]|nr:flagellar biosynthesis protein FliQ [bacterium]